MIVQHNEQYASRSYPFTAEEVESWAALLDAEDTLGLTCIICDQPFQRNAYGQYIKSAAHRIKSDNPEGTIKLYTLKIRRTKRGTIYEANGDCCSWLPEDVSRLRELCISVFRHEVGHYMDHRIGGCKSPGMYGDDEPMACAYEQNPTAWKAKYWRR